MPVTGATTIDFTNFVNLSEDPVGEVNVLIKTGRAVGISAGGNSEGDIDELARGNHVHNHPSGLGVDLHHDEAHGLSKHTEGTPWRLLFINGSGDEAVIVLGASGTYLKGKGASAAPAFEVLGDHDHTGDSGSGATIDLLSDDDGDTKVQVEESADEDIIRHDAAGAEIMTIGHDGAVDILHTAAAQGEHALEVITDAAGKGSVHALDIVLDTGAMDAGKDEEAALINIDESQATGGSVAGLKVLSTEGSASVHALEVGVVIGPIHQLSGAFVAMDVALVKTTNRLTEFLDTEDDIGFFVADNDDITIGDAAQFLEIEFLLETVSSKNVKPTFEYSKAGGLWEPFFPSDGTNGMQNSGVIAWEPPDVASPAWVVHAGNYRIRITRTKGGSITPPVENKVQIAAAVEFEWDKDGNITANSLGVTGNITVGGTVDGVDIAARDHAEAHTIESHSDATASAAELETAVIEVTFEGNGIPITTGIKYDKWIPFACTVKSWRLMADQDGAIVIDIWNKADGAANYPPTNGEAMPGAGKEPTISASDDYAEDDAITDWTSDDIAAESTLRFYVDSCTTITRCTLALKVVKV
jgi:hypothetical protein